MADILGLLISFSPLILFVLVIVLKVDAAVTLEESFGSWISKRLEAARYGDSRISRWYLTPVFSSMNKVREWTGNMKNQYFRAALRLFINLNIAWLALCIAVAVVMIIVMFAIMAFVISVIDNEPRPSGGNGGNNGPNDNDNNKDKDKRRRKGKYRGDNVTVDEKGAMHDNGSIFASRIGEVTDDGRVIEGTTLFGHDARVDSSGTIRDNSGNEVGELD